MLLGVQYGDENVEVGEQLAQAAGGFERDSEVVARVPFGHRFIERMGLCSDAVFERLEESPQQRLAAPAWDHSQPGLQWNRRVSHFLSLFTLAGKRAAKHL